MSECVMPPHHLSIHTLKVPVYLLINAFDTSGPCYNVFCKCQKDANN